VKTRQFHLKTFTTMLTALIVLSAAAGLGMMLAGCSKLPNPMRVDDPARITNPDDAIPSTDPNCEGLSVSQCRAKYHKECTTQCDQLHMEALRAAWEEHKRILAEVCGPLPWADEKVCRQEEHARYKLVKKQIEDDKKACKQACAYSEGSGSGGR